MEELKKLQECIEAKDRRIKELEEQLEKKAKEVHTHFHYESKCNLNHYAPSSSPSQGGASSNSAGCS